MPITNEQGQVALKYLKGIPKYIRFADGKQYVFSVKVHVSMSWVDPEDVDRILAIKEGCCGNRNKQAFVYANELDVQRWTS